MLAPTRGRTKDERLSRVHLDRDEALRRAVAADHGVLATLDRDHGPSLVPACYAIDGDRLAIPIDSVKPKGSTVLGRVRNLERDPRASLLIEHWDAADWSRLWWVRAELQWHREPDAGRTASLAAGLAERYSQYRDQPFARVLVFQVVRMTGWSASEI